MLYVTRAFKRDITLVSCTLSSILKVEDLLTTIPIIDSCCNGFLARTEQGKIKRFSHACCTLQELLNELSHLSLAHSVRFLGRRLIDYDTDHRFGLWWLCSPNGAMKNKTVFTRMLYASRAFNRAVTLVSCKLGSILKVEDLLTTIPIIDSCCNGFLARTEQGKIKRFSHTCCTFQELLNELSHLSLAHSVRFLGRRLIDYDTDHRFGFVLAF